MMYGYGNGIGGWGYALMAIGMVLFWGAVIYGIPPTSGRLPHPSSGRS